MSSYDDTPIGTFDFHHSMLLDDVRVESFLRAILAIVRPGDIVLDIGAGTGLLTLFAALAGAKHIYAVEQEPIIAVAEEVVGRNGYSDRVTFLEGSSLEVELPERADVLVTETIGNAGFDEGITRWCRDAFDRLLVPGARVVPARLALEAALVTVPRDYEQVDRWDSPLHTFDLSPLRRLAVNNILWADLSPAHVAAPPTTMVTVDLTDSPAEMRGSQEFTVIRDGVVHGMGVWFRSELADGVVISNEPPNATPSWEQGFLALDEPMEVAAGQVVDAWLQIEDDGATWSWSVGGGSGATSAGRLR